MKQSMFWILLLCWFSTCDVRATDSKRDNFNNNVQNPVTAEWGNGKQTVQANDNSRNSVTLGPRFSNMGRQATTKKPQEALPKQVPEDVLDKMTAPKSPVDNLKYASESEGKFTMDFMAVTEKLAGGKDFVISPFGIWTITTMIFSAAGGKTAAELSKLLRTDKDPSKIEAAFQAALAVVNSNTENVESRTVNLGASFSHDRIEQQILNHYQSVYNAKWFTLSKGNLKNAAKKVNGWAASATGQRISEIVYPNDFNGLKVFLASASFFKGRWQQPFNVSSTFPDAFKDENDVIVETGVPMMRMRSVLQYGYSTKLECQILELPYADGTTSMLIFLPRRKVSVRTVLENMRGSSLAELVSNELLEEEVDVSIPRFSTEFKADLNGAFSHLNAGSMHNPDAELPKISNDTFISKITHIAEIETSEEGTTASSVTGALVSYKTSATNFQANRPFIYFINHMPSRLILFSGKISKPKPQ